MAAPAPPGGPGRGAGRGAGRRHVVVIGSINVDLVVTVARHPSPGETVLGAGGRLLPGGKGANQAVAAARLGAATTMVGAVGDDPNAGAATAGLRDNGVELSGVLTRPGPTGLAVVTVAADGENSIVVIPGANATVTPADVERHRDLLADAAIVVVQGELPRATVEAAALTAHAVGARLILNLAPAIDLSAEVLRLADPLVVNEHEARHALDLLDGGAASSPRRALALRRAGVPSVVVTVGEAGALVAGDEPGVADGAVIHVAAPRVDVRDTTGAGDAFVGALAARLAGGDGLLPAARVAVRVGAYSVSRDGAQPSYPAAGDPLP